MDDAPNKSTKYNVTIFDQWTPLSTYLLGYLEADGWIKFDKQTARICFQMTGKDLDFLEQLKQATGFTGKITQSTNKVKEKEYNKIRFTISSRIWYDFFRKNFRQNKIPNIPEELIHHYVRGYFDGDGSIYFSKQVKDYKSSFVFSTEELAVAFKNELELHEIKVSNVHKKINAECWYFQLGNLQTVKLGKFMYQDGNLNMNRKYKQFKAQLELRNNNQGG